MPLVAGACDRCGEAVCPRTCPTTRAVRSTLDIWTATAVGSAASSGRRGHRRPARARRGPVWAGRNAAVQLRLAMPEAKAGIGSLRQVGGAQPTFTLLLEDDTAQRPIKEDR